MKRGFNQWLAWLVAAALVLTQTACVSTGPRQIPLSAMATKLKPGERIVLGLKDGVHVETDFVRVDGDRIVTSGGDYAFDDVQRVIAKRFAPGETVARTGGLYLLLNLIVILVVGAYLKGWSEGNGDRK